MIQKSAEGPKWFAIYTKPRFEKKIFETFTQKNIKSFLPLRRVQKKWSDRKKWVEEPLFKSYIFVNIGEDEKLNTLSTHGVVKFVSSQGRPVVVPESDIIMVKRLTRNFEGIDCEEYNFEPGQPIEIMAGEFMHQRGRLIDYRGTKRVALDIECIGRSLIITLPLSFIKPMDKEEHMYS